MWDCGYDSAFRSGIIVEHSSQDFLRNVKETTVDRVIVRFWISSSVSEIFVVKVKSCLKSRQIFLHVFGPKFFFGKAPKILDQDYKIKCTSSSLSLHFSTLLFSITCKNFVTIGQESSEILCRKRTNASKL